MKCALCTHEVVHVNKRYHCTHCSLVLIEELVIPRKRPVIAHFEDRHAHKQPLLWRT